MCSTHMNVEHQISHVGHCGSPDIWVDSSQKFGPFRDSSTVAFEPSEFPHIEDFIGDSLDHGQSYTYDSQGTTLTPSSSMQSLPLSIQSFKTWPSILTNSTIYSSPSVASCQSQILTLPGPEIAYPSPVSVLPVKENETKQGATSTRRTLTDDERRQICQYHKDNPSVKQAKIGEDPSSHPSKRVKGKHQEIERTLANWARKSEEQGNIVPDKVLQERGVDFAKSVNHMESIAKIKNHNWLQKFKQKNNIGNRDLTRRNSAPPKAISTSSGSDSGFVSQISEETNSSSSCLPTVGLTEGEAESKKFVNFSHTELQSNSTSNSNLFFGSMSICSSIPQDLSQDNSTLISPKQSDLSSPVRSIQRARRQTCPVLELHNSNRCTQSPQDTSENIGSTSEVSLSIDSQGSKMESVCPIDISISSLSPKGKDGISYNLPSTTMENTNHHSLFGSSTFGFSATQEGAFHAFDFLISYYEHLNKEFISSNEYVKLQTLAIRMGLGL